MSDIVCCESCEDNPGRDILHLMKLHNGTTMDTEHPEFDVEYLKRLAQIECDKCFNMFTEFLAESYAKVVLTNKTENLDAICHGVRGYLDPSSILCQGLFVNLQRRQGTV
jgi:hypothetical protein